MSLLLHNPPGAASRGGHAPQLFANLPHGDQSQECCCRARISRSLMSACPLFCSESTQPDSRSWEQGGLVDVKESDRGRLGHQTTGGHLTPNKAHAQELALRQRQTWAAVCSCWWT